MLIEHHIELRNDKVQEGKLNAHGTPRFFLHVVKLYWCYLHEFLAQETHSVIRGICQVSVVGEGLPSLRFLSSLIRKVCRSEYGVAPDVKIDGHVNSSFPYITTPLNYIVPEMLKNAFR